MATVETILQGQGVGHQIGGVSAATTQYVQDAVAKQQTNGGGGGGGGGGFGPSAQTPVNWEPFAWLLLGMI